MREMPPVGALRRRDATAPWVETSFLALALTAFLSSRENSGSGSPPPILLLIPAHPAPGKVWALKRTLTGKERANARGIAAGAFKGGAVA